MAKRDVVVIGASLGGIDALQALAAGLPRDFPGVVALVLHVGSFASTLPEMLSAAGPLPAQHARDDAPALPGRIYVAPPDRHLLFEGERLRLSHGPKEHHTRPAVDPLFRSAAVAAGPRVIGVVLTGSLDDGAAGLQAIKACGGLAVVQAPADAQEPSMPCAALAAVQADHCLPAAAMGPLLARLVREPAAPRAAAPSWLVHEQRAATGASDSMEELAGFARPSTLMCPECQGPLWEVSGSRPPRWRCHTGHAFSLHSLAAAQADATEAALWAGVRALQERELLQRRIAALDREAGDGVHAARAEAEAQRLRTQAELLRGLIEAPGADDPSSGEAAPDRPGQGREPLP